MRFRTLSIGLGLLIAIAPMALAQQPALDDDTDKTLYVLGAVLAQKVAQFDLTADELKLVQAGFTDGALRQDLRVALEVYGPKIEPMLRERLPVVIARQKEAGTAYYAKVAGEPGVEKTESGLLFLPIAPGSGASPAATDTVRLQYHGTLPDGTVFDTSRKGDNTPATFAVNAVIPCFSEGVQKLKVGAKAKIVCPADLAYGDRGSPPAILPGATLTFEVELVEIVAAPAAPAATP